METNGRGGLVMDADTAERIAGFLSGQDGVLGATVAARGGALLASRGVADPQTEATLAAFVCERAAEAVAADDLRGMGKLVSESTFERLAISGASGEALVIVLNRGCLLLSARLGGLAAAAQSAVPVISRFGPPAQGPQGG